MSSSIDEGKRRRLCHQCFFKKKIHILGEGAVTKQAKGFRQTYSPSLTSRTHGGEIILRHTPEIASECYLFFFFGYLF